MSRRQRTRETFVKYQREVDQRRRREAKSEKKLARRRERAGEAQPTEGQP